MIFRCIWINSKSEIIYRLQPLNDLRLFDTQYLPKAEELILRKYAQELIQLFSRFSNFIYLLICLFIIVVRLSNFSPWIQFDKNTVILEYISFTPCRIAFIELSFNVCTTFI